MKQINRKLLVVCCVLAVALPVFLLACFRAWGAALAVVCVYLVVVVSVAFLPRMFAAARQCAVRYWRIGAVAVLALMAARALLPCPIEGCWRGYLTCHMCDAHAFLRFSGGRVFYCHGGSRPAYSGTYTRTGWNRYEWLVPQPGKTHLVVTVSTGWIFSRLCGGSAETGTDGWMCRDYQFWDAGRLVKAADEKARQTDSEKRGLPVRP